MNTESLAFAAYWRNSLADAELGRGVLTESDTQSWLKPPAEEVSSGAISEDFVRQVFAEAPPGQRSVEVVLRPWAFRRLIEHGKVWRDGIPELITPLVAKAYLQRDGSLVPAINPVVPRDLLEPLEHGSFAIGHVAEQDRYLTEREAPLRQGDVTGSTTQSWAAYFAYCEDLVATVCPSLTGDTRFIRLPHGYLTKSDSAQNMARHILALYDRLRTEKPAVPLFQQYAATREVPLERCLRPNSCFAQRLGHSGPGFPLAEAQRDALSHLLTGREGEILAVNGPPGTGKTTLLLSVVATLWSKAALEGGEPPFIVAASTNNQAVTNIIDAFGKDFAIGSGRYPGRWLPDIASFGSYFPSIQKLDEVARTYQTQRFFEIVESKTYVEKAEAAFLKSAASSLEPECPTTVEAAVAALQQRMRTLADQLAELESHWNSLEEQRGKVIAALGNPPEARLAQLKDEAAKAMDQHGEFVGIKRRWDQYLGDEPLWLSLFSWLRPVATKRLVKANNVIRDIWPRNLVFEEWGSFHGIKAAIDQRAKALYDDVRRTITQVENAERLMDELATKSAAWQDYVRNAFPATDPVPASLADCEGLADTGPRFELFQLATHYWEGRWLLDMKALLPTLEIERKKRGRAAVQARWLRRMKLTPCAVSTFHMLPKEMEIARRVDEKLFIDYLYNFADLLIVDEAGQVLPEVAGASFALAKKALVIGDTKQIAPIWAIPRHVDIGNLISTGLIDQAETETGFERLTDVGKTASAGSVMRIAQQASRFHYETEMPRGMFLNEHRRCYDEIVAYCNELCYRGRLRPMRGHRQRNTDGLPSMGYLHVPGLCQRHGSSRRNLHEAEVIGSWIAERRESLEAQYGKPIHQIIGVVTPFGPQARAIASVCGRRGIRTGGGKDQLTVGTVHSLQGAERPIVIFSPTYSKHAKGPFIDRDASMLNVAVSRAKDSFLVFGDMDVLNPEATATPSGLLARHLLLDNDSRLEVALPPRSDLQRKEAPIIVLRDAAEHDAFLVRAIRAAHSEVVLVTPWLRAHRIEESGALAPMSEAIARGVKVTVYADPQLSVGSKRGESTSDTGLHEAVALLEAQGVKVRMTNRVHSKIVMCDDNVCCIGSFNWFGADRTGNYARHETSVVYQGDGVAQEIQINKTSIESRVRSA